MKLLIIEDDPMDKVTGSSRSHRLGGNAYGSTLYQNRSTPIKPDTPS